MLKKNHYFLLYLLSCCTIILQCGLGARVFCFTWVKSTRVKFYPGKNPTRPSGISTRVKFYPGRFYPGKTKYPGSRTALLLYEGQQPNNSQFTYHLLFRSLEIIIIHINHVSKIKLCSSSRKKGKNQNYIGSKKDISEFTFYSLMVN